MTLLRRCLPLVALAAAACDAPTRTAMGDVNSIIVVAEDSLWNEVADTVLTTLQPRTFAVRDEPTFQLTHTSPAGPHWGELRRFRQILAIGRPEDPWVARALERGRVGEDEAAAPAIVEADRVWARNQWVTAVVVPEEGAAEAVRGALDSLASLLDRRYRVWTQERMYISGLDRALMDTLRAEGGFEIAIPEVYRWRQASEAAFLFLNDNPDASQLVRWVTVTWRPRSDAEITQAAALAWRDSVADLYYDWGQTTQRERLETARIEAPASGGLAIRGIWAGTEAFPQAGPFITYVVDCPAQNRRYLLDAWLYAPARDKYQYMIQLETLLGSFECL